MSPYGPLGRYFRGDFHGNRPPVLAKCALIHQRLSRPPAVNQSNATAPQASGSGADIANLRRLVHDDMQLVDDLIERRLYSEVGLINQLSHYIINSGGKRLRPALVLLSARALNYQGNQHIELAAIIEFIHTATLLHDDVVDASKMRRGHQTANQRWGNEASVLVGDFIYSRAFQLMVTSDSLRVLKLLADASNTIAVGEVEQLAHAHNPDLSETTYMEVIRRKTSTLFSAGCELGAVLGNMDETCIEALARYGLHLGNAFQLVDDLLDYQGEVSAIGKNIGDDLNDGKTTLPLIHIMRHGSAEQAEMVREAIREGDGNRIGEIIAAIESTGAIAYTRELASRESRAASEALSALPPTPYRDAMSQLAEFALARTY